MPTPPPYLNPTPHPDLGLTTLVYSYVGPFLWNHSELLLPFAAANAIAATFWYCVLEATIGLPAMTGELPAFMQKQSADAVPSFVRGLFKVLGLGLGSGSGIWLWSWLWLWLWSGSGCW